MESAAPRYTPGPEPDPLKHPFRQHRHHRDEAEQQRGLGSRKQGDAVVLPVEVEGHPGDAARRQQGQVGRGHPQAFPARRASSGRTAQAMMNRATAMVMGGTSTTATLMQRQDMPHRMARTMPSRGAKPFSAPAIPLGAGTAPRAPLAGLRAPSAGSPVRALARGPMRSGSLR